MTAGSPAAAFGRLVVFSCLVLTVGGILACGSGNVAPVLNEVVVTPILSEFPPDSDDRHATNRLGILSEAARGLIEQHIPNAVLRQTMLDRIDGTPMFFFTDVDSTQLVTVVADSPNTPYREWRVAFHDFSPLLTRTDPGIDFHRLRFGPVAAVREAIKHRLECESPHMILWSEEPQLTWQVTCDSGGVQIRMDGITGASSVYPDY